MAGKRLSPLVSAWLVTFVLASNMLVMYDSLPITTSDAGFWMILALGASIGASAAVTAIELGKKKAKTGE